MTDAAWELRFRELRDGVVQAVDKELTAFTKKVTENAAADLKTELGGWPFDRCKSSQCRQKQGSQVEAVDLWQAALEAPDGSHKSCLSLQPPGSQNASVEGGWQLGPHLPSLGRCDSREPSQVTVVTLDHLDRPSQVTLDQHDFYQLSDPDIQDEPSEPGALPSEFTEPVEGSTANNGKTSWKHLGSTVRPSGKSVRNTQGSNRTCTTVRSQPHFSTHSAKSGGAEGGPNSLLHWHPKSYLVSKCLDDGYLQRWNEGMVAVSSVRTDCSGKSGWVHHKSVANKATTKEYDKGTRTPFQEAADHLVRSDNFEYFWIGMILFSALLLGVQTDIYSRVARGEMENIVWVDTLSTIVCLAFAVELALRLYVYRVGFFWGAEWYMNVFDSIIVVANVFETLLTLFLEPVDGLDDLILFRILRIVRMARILRVAHVMHLLTDLRTMISSVISSLRSICWYMLLLFGLIYVISIVVTQVVADRIRSCDDCGIEMEELTKYYGTLWNSMATFFMSISGGVDWGDACKPLVRNISPIMGALFLGYVAFTTFSMLNVITGIVVDTALKSSMQEVDVEMVKILKEVFHNAEDGRLTWTEFEEQLENPKLVAYFKSIDLDVSEARGLFDLLDIVASDSIDRDDFISGCVRLRGPAKAIDLAMLMSEMRRLRVEYNEIAQDVEESGSKPELGGCGSMSMRDLGVAPLFPRASTQGNKQSTNDRVHMHNGDNHPQHHNGDRRDSCMDKVLMHNGGSHQQQRHNSDRWDNVLNVPSRSALGSLCEAHSELI